MKCEIEPVRLRPIVQAILFGIFMLPLLLMLVPHKRAEMKQGQLRGAYSSQWTSGYAAYALQRGLSVSCPDGYTISFIAQAGDWGCYQVGYWAGDITSAAKLNRR